MALHVRADRLPFETSIKTDELYPASQLLSSIVGFDVQPNKAIVGRNAFAHEAGIHQHGVINNPLCYEIMTPESVGVPANSLVLGKHSGRHALSLRYAELGYDITPTELDAAYRSFTNLADRKKRVYDQDLISLLRARRASGHKEHSKQLIWTQRLEVYAMRVKITILPGDGIGPEVTAEAVRVLQTVAGIHGYRFEFEEHAIGGVAIQQFGSPLPRKTLDACLASMRCCSALSARRNTIACRRINGLKRACCC